MVRDGAIDSGKAVLCGHGLGALRLVDTQTGELIRTLDARSDVQPWRMAIAAAPEGHHAALAALGGHRPELEICDLKDGRRTQIGGITHPSSIAWSPDSRWIAVGVPSAVDLLTAPTGDPRRRLPAGRTNVTRVAFSPDSQILASGDEAGEITTWDLTTGQQLSSVQAHPRAVWGLIFNPSDSTLISSGQDGSIRRWDAKSLRLVQWVGIARNCGELPFPDISTNGKIVISATTTVQTWSLEGPRESASLSPLGPGGEGRMEFSADGSALMASSESGVSMYDPATGRVLCQLHVPGTDAALLPDGRTVVAAGKDGLKFWDTRSAARVRTVDMRPGTLRRIALLTAGGDIACSFAKGPIRVLDSKSGQFTRTICTTQPSGGFVATFAASPDGRKILGAIRGDLFLWDANQTDHRTSFASGGANVTWVTWSHDGTIAAASYSESAAESHDAKVTIWDMALPKERRTIGNLWSTPTRVAISNDSKRLICGFADGSVGICDLEGSQEFRRVGSHETQMAIPAVTFSPDGQQAASTATDGTVKLWDFSRLETDRHPEQWDAAWKKIRQNPGDRTAMARIGQWYAFRGKWDWAAELLESARKGGRTFHRSRWPAATGNWTISKHLFVSFKRRAIGTKPRNWLWRRG